MGGEGGRWTLAGLFFLVLPLLLEGIQLTDYGECVSELVGPVGEGGGGCGIFITHQDTQFSTQLGVCISCRPWSVFAPFEQKENTCKSVQIPSNRTTESFSLCYIEEGEYRIGLGDADAATPGLSIQFTRRNIAFLLCRLPSISTYTQSCT